MFKNPLNADNDINELVAELRKENSDAKTVTKLQLKILAKGTAQGILIGAGIGLAGIGALVLTSKALGPVVEDDEEEADD
jgi:hypothetical protein